MYLRLCHFLDAEVAHGSILDWPPEADAAQGKLVRQVNIAGEHYQESRVPTIWLTYAWDDNRAGDVNYVAQELGSDTVNMKLDQWSIRAGKRLWEQIGTFISDPKESDAWM